MPPYDQQSQRRQREERRRATADGRGFNLWLERVRRWLDQLFARDSPDSQPTILAEFSSEYVRARSVRPTYSDELVERIRDWRIVCISPEIGYDLVLTCDRLLRSEKARQTGELASLVTSHRFALFRVSKYLIGGKRRKDQILIADLDCIQTQVFRGLDGFAPQICDSLAVQLTKRSLPELRRLAIFEDEFGIENHRERLAVSERWLDQVRFYHSQYFP
jgi:hypothetical protein